MIQDVIERLKTKASSLADVRPAEDIDALSRGTAPRHGTAFVLPFREKADPNGFASGKFRQHVQVQLLVAIVLRRHDDARGGEKAVLFDTLKEDVEQALAGWATHPRNGLFELVAGQAASIGNGASVYVQTWQTSRYLET